jgi:hypothetical protein
MSTRPRHAPLSLDSIECTLALRDVYAQVL